MYQENYLNQIEQCHIKDSDINLALHQKGVKL